MQTLAGSRSPSCLLVNHGVFAVGPTAEKAVQAAVMTEDNAAIMYYAYQLGEPIPIPQADIDRLAVTLQEVL